MFNIIDIESGEPIREAGAVMVVAEGKLAASIARQYTKEFGKQFKPKKVIDDSWHNRELNRFYDGTYLELPDEWQSLIHCSSAPKLHFPHVSLQDQTKVAFTETPEKGMADVQTMMKPAKYLQKFYGKTLDADDIKWFCVQFARKFEDNKLMFGDTADDFVMVYDNGPSSCMNFGKGGDGHRFFGPVHPATVYAAGDLAIAYMKRDGKITARTVVFPARKTHSRIYGDIDRLTGLLKKEGYQWGQPLGAKLLRIVSGNHDSRGAEMFVCPYIDAGTDTGQGSLRVKDDGKNLIITNETHGVYYANSTTGTTTQFVRPASAAAQRHRYCTHCEEEFDDPSDLSAVYSGPRMVDYYCENCCDDYAYWCDAENIYVHGNYAVSMFGGDTDEWWSTWFFEQNGFRSDLSGDNFHRRDRTYFYSGPVGRDGEWPYRIATSHELEGSDDYKRCAITGEWWETEWLVVHPRYGLIAPNLAESKDPGVHPQNEPPLPLDTPDDADLDDVTRTPF